MLQIPQALLDTNLTKETLHHSGRKFLRSVADALELKPDSFELRSNKGIEGGMGEVILHSDHIYIQVHASDDGPGVLHRTCKGREDFAGGQNRYVRVSELRSHTCAERFVSKLQHMLNQAQTPFHATTGGQAHA